MITLTEVPATAQSVRYWVVEADGGHSLQCEQLGTCQSFRATAEARVLAEQMIDPQETEERSFLRELGLPESALSALGAGAEPPMSRGRQ